MKRNIILLFLLPALLIAGCENPMDGYGPDGDNPEVFTATIDGSEPATKTLLAGQLGGTRPVLWAEGDSLRINGLRYNVSELSADTLTAKLIPAGERAQKDAGKYKAWYPTSIYNGDTPTLPATQVYRGTKTTDKGTYPVIAELPMYAEETGTTLNFRNLCAVLNIQMKQGTNSMNLKTDTIVTRVVVTSTANYLSGPFKVKEVAPSGSKKWYAEIDGSAAGASKTVELDCTGGVSGGGVQLGADSTDFFIAVPAQAYDADDLTITVYGRGVVENVEKEIASFTNIGSALNAEPSKIYTIRKSVNVLFSASWETEGAPDGYIFSGASITEWSSFEDVVTVETNVGYRCVGSNVQLISGELSKSGSFSGTLRFRVPPIKSGAYPASQFTEADFSVSPTRKVRFSPGNLQFRAYENGVAVNKWRFAERQTDYVGSGSTLVRYMDLGTVYADGVKCDNDLASATYDGWIDLFAWGTTNIHYRSGEHHYEPWKFVDDPTFFGPESNQLSWSDQSDWGVNEIGSYPAKTYRTLTVEESEYLLVGRAESGEASYMLVWVAPSSASTAYIVLYPLDIPTNIGNALYINMARYNSVPGTVYFPDGFRTNYPSLVSKYEDYINTTAKGVSISSSEWTELEQAGCVFLPGAGVRIPSVNGGRIIPGVKAYWLSDGYSDSAAYSRVITPADSYSGLPANAYLPKVHFKQNLASVRLVKDVN